MSQAPMMAALGLAAVFAVAGTAKFADLEGSRRAVKAFGVPQPLAGSLGALLPAAELTTAALLVAGLLGGGGMLVAGALSAFGLLAIFCAAIALNLLRGHAPNCHCFGQLHSAPAGRRTLARNGALLSAATFVASGGEPVATIATGIAVIAILTIVTLGLRGRTAAAHAGPTGAARPAEGSRAPPFELTAPTGPRLSLAALLRRGRPVVLIFSDAECGPCTALAPTIAEWQRLRADDLTIAVIERADYPTSIAFDVHGRRNVLLDHGGDVAGRYGVEGTPSAVVVAADGTFADGMAAGGPAIEALLGRAVPEGEPNGAGVQGAPERTALGRRELLARAAATWAAAAGLLAAPGLATGQIDVRCRYKRCGKRCCPRGAKCRRRRGRRVCICPDGRRACRERCCPATFVCRGRGRRRRCVCPSGYRVCSGRCIRLQDDPGNCGRCDRECPVGTSCVAGECVGGDGSGTGPGGSGGCECPPGKACCEGQCVDLNESDEHCGDCARPCAGNQTCCGGRCRNPAEDPQNCGRCGRRCLGDEVCSEGECRRRCRDGLRNCGGHCVDTSSDDLHCGGCEPCAGPFDTGECCNGECCDYNGSTCCAGGCKNLALDDENCGACGKACPPGSFCRFGTCSSF